MGCRYRVGEFAALTGVSVRTLHHYDRIGLVHPSAHSEGGHRLYSEQDLLRLQQVLTLRYLGFPLKEVGELLDRPDFDIVASMWAQRRALRERISELERIEAVLGELVERRLANGCWDWEQVARASAAVQDGLSPKGDTMDKIKGLYTAEQLAEFEQIGQQMPPGAREEIERRWAALIAEVRASRHLDPASPEVQALADRWDALTEETMSWYQGHDELKAAIGEHYRQGHFEEVPEAPNQQDFTFIARVKQARTGGGVIGPASD